MRFFFYHPTVANHLAAERLNMWKALWSLKSFYIVCLKHEHLSWLKKKRNSWLLLSLAFASIHAFLPHKVYPCCKASVPIVNSFREDCLNWYMNNPITSVEADQNWLNYMCICGILGILLSGPHYITDNVLLMFWNPIKISFTVPLMKTIENCSFKQICNFRQFANSRRLVITLF